MFRLILAVFALGLLAACATPAAQVPATKPVSSAPAATPTSIPPSPTNVAPTDTATITAQSSATSTPVSSQTKAIATVTVSAPRMIFASVNQSPLFWAQLMVQNVKLSNTSYQHKDNGVTWAGVNGATDYLSYADCSGFMNALITQSYGIGAEDFAQWLGSRRPLAKDYFAAIENKRGLTPVTNIANVQAGNFIVIRYPNSIPGDNTGHILIAAAIPQRRTATKPIENNTQQWDVAIIDSSESGHGKEDTRRLTDASYHDGVGRGTMRLYTDNNGALVGYTWSDLADSLYYDATVRPLAIGRLDPKFSLP